MVLIATWRGHSFLLILFRSCRQAVVDVPCHRINVLWALGPIYNLRSSSSVLVYSTPKLAAEAVGNLNLENPCHACARSGGGCLEQALHHRTHRLAPSTPQVSLRQPQSPQTLSQIIAAPEILVSPQKIAQLNFPIPCPTKLPPDR